jgi:hypothetical protein
MIAGCANERIASKPTSVDELTSSAANRLTSSPRSWLLRQPTKMPDVVLPSRCPECNTTSVFMHRCECSDLPYVHIVCDACDTAFKPETLAEIAAKEVA